MSAARPATRDVAGDRVTEEAVGADGVEAHEHGD
jgi:hypothetical protein